MALAQRFLAPPAADPLTFYVLFLPSFWEGGYDKKVSVVKAMR